MAKFCVTESKWNGGCESSMEKVIFYSKYMDLMHKFFAINNCSKWTKNVHQMNTCDARTYLRLVWKCDSFHSHSFVRFAHPFSSSLLLCNTKRSNLRSKENDLQAVVISFYNYCPEIRMTFASFIGFHFHYYLLNLHPREYSAHACMDSATILFLFLSP